MIMLYKFIHTSLFPQDMIQELFSLHCNTIYKSIGSSSPYKLIRLILSVRDSVFQTIISVPMSSMNAVVAVVVVYSSSRTDRWVHFQQNAGLRLFVHP